MLLRAVCVWAIIMGCETLMGIVRAGIVANLVKGNGASQAIDLAARQIGVFIGSGMIFLVCWVMIRWMCGRRLNDRLVGTKYPLETELEGIKRSLLGIGVMWSVLTVGFEVGIGWLMMRGATGVSGQEVSRDVWERVWMRMGEDYDIRRGGLMGIGMAVLILAPIVAAWARGVIKR